MSESVPPASERLPPQHVIDFAVEISQWSPCRSKRGVVLFEGVNIVSHGYNYKPRGFDCDGSDACKATCRVEAVHAEQQALLSASNRARDCEMLHVKTVNGRLVASGGPSCVQCSKLALVSGVSGVWLYHESGWRWYPMAEFHRLSLLTAPSQAQTPDGDTYPWGEKMPQYAVLGIGAKAWVELEDIEKRSANYSSRAGVSMGLDTFRVVMNVLRAIRLKDFAATPPPPAPRWQEKEKRP